VLDPRINLLDLIEPFAPVLNQVLQSLVSGFIGFSGWFLLFQYLIFSPLFGMFGDYFIQNLVIRRLVQPRFASAVTLGGLQAALLVQNLLRHAALPGQ